MARPRKSPSDPADLSAALAFSVADAARLIGVNSDLINKSIDGGGLKARRLGGRLLVTRHDLQSFLQALPERPTKGSNISTN